MRIRRIITSSSEKLRPMVSFVWGEALYNRAGDTNLHIHVRLEDDRTNFMLFSATIKMNLARRTVNVEQAAVVLRNFLHEDTSPKDINKGGKLTVEFPLFLYNEPVEVRLQIARSVFRAFVLEFRKLYS